MSGDHSWMKVKALECVLADRAEPGGPLRVGLYAWGEVGTFTQQGQPGQEEKAGDGRGGDLEGKRENNVKNVFKQDVNDFQMEELEKEVAAAEKGREETAERQ